MLLPDATPPPWRLWRTLERAALHGAPWQHAPAEIALNDATPDATLVAMGDVALLGSIGRDPRAVFGTLCDVLERADLRTANLEAVLTGRTQPAGTIGSFIRSDPGNVALLRDAGFDVMTVANNHVLDFGHEGLGEALNVLADAGIGACGAGGAPDAAESACAPGAAAFRTTHSSIANLVVREVRGLRVGFVGFCDDWYGGLRHQDGGGPRPAAATPDTMAATLQEARPQVDFLVCHAHWGYEFTLHPMARHRRLAHAMLDDGADLVLCHHSHVPAGIEIRGRGAIAYGLGNAIMPMGDYVRAGHPWTDRSFVLEVSFSAHAVHGVRLHPFGLDEAGRMQTLDHARGRGLLRGVAKMSRRLDDEDFLARLERCRLAYEGHALIDGLRNAAQGNPRTLHERLMSLSVPRQRALLDDLARMPGLAPVAEALLQSDGETTPAAAVARYDALEPAFTAAMPALKSAYRWRDALRARVP